MFLPIVFRHLLVDHKKKCTGRRLKNEMQFSKDWSHFKQLQPKEQKQKFYNEEAVTWHKGNRFSNAKSVET